MYIYIAIHCIISIPSGHTRILHQNHVFICIIHTPTTQPASQPANWRAKELKNNTLQIMNIECTQRNFTQSEKSARARETMEKSVQCDWRLHFQCKHRSTNFLQIFFHLWFSSMLPFHPYYEIMFDCILITNLKDLQSMDPLELVFLVYCICLYKYGLVSKQNFKVWAVGVESVGTW